MSLLEPQYVSSSCLRYEGTGMGVVSGANLGLRFVLELMMLVAFGYWGFTIGESIAIRVLFGIGAPVLAIVVWGMFIAPRASGRLGDPPRVALELALFGLAAVALVAADRSDWGIALGVIAIVNIGLLFVFDQR